MSGAPDCLVDLGHTRIKWACGRDGQVLADTAGACALDEAGAFDRFLGACEARRAWVSGQSNSDILADFRERIDQRGLSLERVLTGALDLPVQPAYASLGCDRWLALQWPWLKTRNACCVIDCGTAVSVDLIDRRGRHLGGWIMAGLPALRTGLLERARGLPKQLAAVSDPAQPLRDSAQAVAGGTLLQLVGAIDRAVTASARVIGDAPAVWLTGGDADTLADHLDTPPRRDPWLVLRGLALAAQTA